MLGLTLLELLVTIALVGVLASLAVPSFGEQLARIHLKAAAERMAADMAEARFDAGRQATTMHMRFETGAPWCYAVSATPTCPCGSPSACQSRRALGSDHPGIRLDRAEDLRFDPSNGSIATPMRVTLRTARGDALNVELTRLGRAKICAPESKALGYPACAAL
jgi:type IV fimbrial biogenesis protein FimT